MRSVGPSIQATTLRMGLVGHFKLARLKFIIFNFDLQVLLKQTLMQVMEELRQLQKSRYNIEKDLADKEMAMDIDKKTSIMKVTGPQKKKGQTK